MKALVLWRGSATVGTTLHHLLGFEIRDFVCFNGFNTDSAFTNQRDNFDCVLVAPDRNGEVQNAELSLGCGPTPRSSVTGDRLGLGPSGAVNRQWNCVAIGWLNEIGFGSWDTKKDYPEGGCISRRPVESLVLNNESGFGQYTDVHGSIHASKRILTPNELFVAKVVNNLYRGAEFLNSNNITRIALTRHQRFSGSHCFSTLLLGLHHYSNMAMDFVGSERPSGMAIAYLQVYRNAARTWTSQASTVGTPTVMGLDRIRRSQRVRSIIPLLSCMYNNGGDSDILSHTSRTGLVAAQAMKHGVFTLGEFFQNNASMIQENRYNKGSQSASLGTNILRAASGYRNGDSFGTHVESFRRVADAQTAIVPYLSMGAFTRRGGRAWLAEVQAKVADMDRAGTVDQLVARLEALLVDTYDFRAPPPPVAPAAPQIDTAAVAGAAQGFRQWVSSNNGAFGSTIVRQQTDADRARANAAGTPV